MDLVFDLEMTVRRPEPPRGGATASAESVIALGWWYDKGYDGVPPPDPHAASTAELVAYWWGEVDAVRGSERRNIG